MLYAKARMEVGKEKVLYPEGTRSNHEERLEENGSGSETNIESTLSNVGSVF